MKTTLQFASLFELTNFQAAIKMRSYTINTSALTLTGIFSEAEVELAEECYRATLFQSERSLQRLAI
jgi:alanine racemase